MALQLAAGVGYEGVGEDGVGLVHHIAAIQATVLRVGRERLGLGPGFVLAGKAPVCVRRA